MATDFAPVSTDNEDRLTTLRVMVEQAQAAVDARLHDCMPEHLRDAVLLGAFAGLRFAEVCGLRVADVDIMRGVISPAVQCPAEPL